MLSQIISARFAVPHRAAVLAAALAISCVHAPGGASFTPTPLSAEVRMHQGKPAIFLDGKPETPMIYALTDARGAQFSWEEVPAWNLRQFTRLGFRLFHLSLWLEDLWRQDGTLDTGLVRRQLRGVLDANPHAAIMVRLHVNAPFWWNQAHPEETTEYADGPAHFYQRPWGLERHIEQDLDRVRLHSLASKKWLAETQVVLRRLLAEVAKTPEGNAVAAWHLADGVSHEWHYWGFLQHDPDTGPAMTAYFREWLSRKYGSDAGLRAAWNDPAVSLALATVPSTDERNHTSDGIFRDPARERHVIDYTQAQHEVVADDILSLAKTVKETWPRPVLTGAFYGYFFMMFSRQATGGHLQIDRVMKSPYLDYISAPQSYWGATHDMGGAGQSRALQESALLHGKLVLDEMDSGTSMKHPFDTPPVEKRSDDIALIRRNTLQPLTRGMGMWYFDFGPQQRTGWWAHPDYAVEIQKLKALFDARLTQPLAPAADVLVVWDDDVYPEIAPRWTPISENAVDELSVDLQRSGVAADNIYLHDLALVDLQRYKAVVFPNAWRVVPEMRRLIQTKVARGGRHLIWCYLPGYSDGTRLGLDLTEELSGFSLQRFEAQEKPEVRVDGIGNEPILFSVKNKFSPLAWIQPGEGTTPFGHFSENGKIALASQRHKEHTVWLSILPLRRPEIFRHIFAAAGAHVYSDGNDAVYAGNGLVWLHTAEAGARKVRMRGGQMVEVDLAPRSTTVLDAATGAILMQ